MGNHESHLDIWELYVGIFEVSDTWQLWSCPAFLHRSFQSLHPHNSLIRRWSGRSCGDVQKKMSKSWLWITTLVYTNQHPTLIDFDPSQLDVGNGPSTDRSHRARGYGPGKREARASWCNSRWISNSHSIQWVGFRENSGNHVFPMIYIGGSCKISLKPI